MKTILTYLALLAAVSLCTAQDYFAVVKKKDQLTYHYPENTKFVLYDHDGNTKTINKNEVISVTGDYRLEADVPWSDRPDIIKSDGGTLDIFVVSNAMDNSLTKHQSIQIANLELPKNDIKPVLENTAITPSKKEQELFNGLFVFTNGMVFSYIDGEVCAYQDREKLEISGKYIVRGKNEILKISFNPKNAQMWYVFDNYKRED